MGLSDKDESMKVATNNYVQDMILGKHTKPIVRLPYLVLLSAITAYSLIVLLTKDLGGMQYVALVPILSAFLASWRDKCVLDWVMVAGHMLVFYWGGSGGPLPWK